MFGPATVGQRAAHACAGASPNPTQKLPARRRGSFILGLEVGVHHFAAFVGFTTSTTMPRFWGQTIIHGPMPNRSPTWELFFGKGALGGGRKRRRGPAAATTCSITLTHCLCCCNALSCAGPWDLRRTWTSHPSSWVPFPLQAHNSSPKEMPKTTDVPRWVQDHPPHLCIPEHTLVVHASFPPPLHRTC